MAPAAGFPAPPPAPLHLEPVRPPTIAGPFSVSSLTWTPNSRAPPPTKNQIKKVPACRLPASLVQSLPAWTQTQDDSERNVEKAGETSTSPSYNHLLFCCSLSPSSGIIVNSSGICLVSWFYPSGHRLSLSVGVCTMF